MATATKQRNRSAIRAWQLASELGIDWRDLHQLAQQVGLEIRSQLCGLDEETAQRLRRHFHQQRGGQLPAAVSPAEPPVEQEQLPAEGSLEVGERLAEVPEPSSSTKETTAPSVCAAVLQEVQPREVADQVTPVPSKVQPTEMKVTPNSEGTQTRGAADGRLAQESKTSPAAGQALPESKPTISPTPAGPRTGGQSVVSPPKEAPDLGAKSATAPPTAPGQQAGPGKQATKHLVNLDQLRRRQQEKKQEQARHQAGTVHGQAGPPVRPQPVSGTPPVETLPSPAAGSSTPSAPGSGPIPPAKGSAGRHVPVLQKPKPSSSPGPGSPAAPPKGPTAPSVSFVVRKQAPKPPKEKPPKADQELKPLATLEEVLKQKQQQPPAQQAKPTTTPSPSSLQAPAKTAVDAKLIAQVKDLKLVSPDEEDEERQPIGKRRPGVVPGREERRQRRREEARLRAAKTAAETVAEQEQETETQRPTARRLRAEVKPPTPRPITQPRKGKVPLEPPITVRALSEALGVSVQELLRKLVQRGHLLNINATLTNELAEELALEYNFELEIKKPADPEEEILKQLQAPDNPEDLVARPPVVTVMGHVDHGKTSLLDRIRESDVVSTEAGGITQHLRAWQVDHHGRPITFLDTPGHEAFTAMRARGAHVTDIVVLVVAADDGVMPQTEEAISHARAANVPIIVAINKVDLPNANIQRTRNQLYSLGLVPDTMGGDTPFVETVAAKERPRGIQELLDMISLVAELRELKANPKKPPLGTCLEAKLTEGQGVVATLLVQNGTLHVGDCIVCGTSYGRVRAMFDSAGQPAQQAGPATPVAVTGLDEIPEAGDKFFVVPDLALAREIVQRRRERHRFTEPTAPRTLRLEDLDKTKVQELKIILKADVRGSIEAIRKELEKLQHEEIKLTIIHAGVGAVTEGDVQLALASPEDTLIVGFNVVPDQRAQALAEQRHVQIRLYHIIYQLTDDLKAALEGRLKPREETIQLGRAVVREVFKISKVGTVAGCYVVQGVVERGAQVRVIREGRVIYPPPDRSATIESLRRFKEDVREVREGFECGIKISNFDDVKTDDVLEVFRIVQVQRTLDGTALRSPAS